MRFELDPRKAEANRLKHGVDFEEAATVFEDDYSLTFDDPDHSIGETRLLTFGRSTKGTMLVISHLEFDDTIRIISARPMTRREVMTYEQY